jgi:hypothetical protein
MAVTCVTEEEEKGIGPVTSRKVEVAGLTMRKENRPRLGVGPNLIGSLRKHRNCFVNFPSADLNLNSKLKFKSNAFSNSTKFKHFAKIEI